jgi:hypothetical protein
MSWHCEDCGEPKRPRMEYVVRGGQRMGVLVDRCPICDPPKLIDSAEPMKKKVGDDR